MTYAQIIHYIELLGKAHKQIKGTYTGDYDRIEDLITGHSDFMTPCIWIESPEMTPSGSLDSSRDRWNLAITILDKGDLQNNDVNQSKYESTYRIAREVLYRIQKDSSEGLIKFNLIGKKLSSIDNYSSNGMVGWRIELDIETYSDISCYNPESWDENIEVGNELSFTLQNTGENIWNIVDLKDLNGLGWNYEWQAQSDTSPLTTLTEINEDITATNFLYVQLIAELGIHRRVASCYIVPGDFLTKKSVPYLFNPKDHN